MPKFDLMFTTDASLSVSVTADTLEEAVEQVRAEGFGTLCAQCTGWRQAHDLDLGDEWELNQHSVYQDGEPVPDSEVPQDL